ncbi:MAG: formylglycine-generating enzyme family protein [Methylococcales bacterium]|nr:formylglycine-generating enzyme family protein [Methylococcales bacterium]
MSKFVPFQFIFNNLLLFCSVWRVSVKNLLLILVGMMSIQTIQAADTGKVNLSTGVDGATVFVDEKRYDVTGKKGFLNIELSVGAHVIRVEKLVENGHFKMLGKYSVNVEKDSFFTLNLVLQREPTPAYLEWLRSQNNKSNLSVYKQVKEWLETEFVVVKSGCYMMGSEKGYDDERPVHKVCLNGFSIGKTEVTVGQYKLISRMMQYRKESVSNPATNVSWIKVQQFIKKLNAFLKLHKINKIARLPTEAEWEYAARAGSTTEYSFGDNPLNLNRYAWFQENAGNRAHAVAKKKPNAWGLYDVHGNVYEWVHDWHGQYPAGKVKNPKGVTKGSRRVIRGGDYGGNAGYARSGRRMLGTPIAQGRHVGFRLVYTAPVLGRKIP